MKVIVIADDDNSRLRLKRLLESNGFEVITYTWFLKAIDNLDEIEPDLIIISAIDFPRHWKMLPSLLSVLESKKNTKLVLYISDEFDKFDLEKAGFLGINCIFPANLSDNDIVRGIKQL